jgi:hypothetical protein
VFHWCERDEPDPGSRAEEPVGQSVRPLLAVLGLAVLAGCGGGDSTSTAADPTTIIVESETLFPVRGACHVRGTVRNVRPVQSFDVILRWEAFDGGAKSLGTTRITLDNVLPGERRLYDASGFASNDEGLVRCAQIARFVRIETTANAN